MDQQSGVTLESFAQVLCSLTDPNNGVRKAAESQLNCLSPDHQIWLLINLALSGSQNNVLRLITYVSLKVLLVKYDSTDKLSRETVDLCKNSFIKVLMAEPEKSLRKKMVYCVSALLGYLWDGKNTPWPEMGDFVLQLLFSDNVLSRELALDIITNAPFLFGQTIEDKVLQIQPKLVECLHSANVNPSLAILTMETVGSLAQYCSNKFIKEAFSRITPVLIEVISRMALTEHSTDLFECLAEIVDCSIGIYNKHIEAFISSLLNLMNQPCCNENLDNIFDIIVSVAENSPKHFTQQASQHLPYIIKCSFYLISQIDDEDLTQWLNTIGENEDEISNDLLHRSTTGEVSLDRLARCLDKKVVLDLVLKEIEVCLASDNWKFHNAAIVAIGAVAEGCKSGVKQMLPQIIDRFLPYFQSDNPRIVFSCLNTYGQLAIDFAKYFHSKYHQKVFPAILSVAAGHTYLKVQTNAVLAFGNLIDGCKRKVLRIYCKDIFLILMNTIEKVGQNLGMNGSKHILSICLSAISSLAISFGENFEYYDKVMTLSWSMLNAFESVFYLEMYYEVLDCALSVLDAVGPDKSLPYLREIMRRVERFSELASSSPKAEEYRLNYFKCLEKVCSINSEELCPVLAHLLHELVTFFENDLKDPDDYSMSDQLSSEVSGSANTKFKTAAIEEQSVVCSLLSKVALDLKLQMQPFLPKILPVVFHVFGRVRNEELTCDIAECIVDLLTVCKMSGHNHLMSYWSNVNKVFFGRFYELEDPDFVASYLEHIESLVAVTGQSTMDQEQLIRFGNFLKWKLEKILVSLAEQAENEKKGPKSSLMDDFDDGFYDECTINAAQSTSHKLFEVYGPPFMQIYSIFVNNLFAFLSPDIPAQFRRISLFFFIDVLEFAPSEFWQMEQTILPLIFRDLDTDDMEATQLGVFTIGLLAQSQRQEYLGYLRNYLPLLFRFASTPHKFDVEKMVQCNAIAAIGRCLKFVPSLFIDPVASLHEWLGMLPILEDEADFALEYLCELIEQNINLVFKNDGSNTQHVLTSILKMFFEVGQSVGIKAYGVILKLQSMDQNQMLMAISSLDANNRKELDDLMKDYAAFNV